MGDSEDYAPVTTPEDEEEERRRKSDPYPPVTAPDVVLGARQFPNPNDLAPQLDTDNPPATRMPKGTTLGPIPATGGVKFDTSNPAPSEIIPSPVQEASAGYAPAAPAMGSIADLEARAAKPRIAPVAPPPEPSPAQARLEKLTAQGAPPVEPLHGWKKTLDIIGQAIPRTQGLEQALRYGPQREYGRNLGQAEKDVAGETAAAEESAKREAAALGPEAKRATIEETNARAEALRNPQAKEGLTPEETTIHDLMTGENGQPRVNPQTGKPYQYLEAFSALEAAKAANKPEPKPDSPEQQYIDEYQRTHKGATVAQAVAAYTAATQKPERAGAGNARSDKSYTYNNDKLDKLGKPLEDAVARMGRLRETLTQGTPQADALVAPELLTIMAGGQGSGLRMNEAEIARIVGGRSKWESLQAAVNQWRLDPTKANSITAEQRTEIRGLMNAVHVKLQAKQQALDQARERLLDSDDPKEHRHIVTDAHHTLTQLDEQVGGGVQHVPGGQAQGLKEGQTGTGSDNQKYVVKNGVWVPQ